MIMKYLMKCIVVLVAVLSFFPAPVKAEKKFAFEAAGKSQPIGNWFLIENKDAFDDSILLTALLPGETSYLPFKGELPLSGPQSTLQLSYDWGKLRLLVILNYTKPVGFLAEDKIGLMFRKGSDEPIASLIQLSELNLQDGGLVLGLYQGADTNDKSIQMLNGESLAVSATNTKLTRITAIFKPKGFSDVIMALKVKCLV